MSRNSKRAAAWLLAAALTGTTAAFLPACNAPSRQVVLIARGMTFVLADAAGGPNPALQVSPGERIRLTLRNETPGVSHDLAVPAWDVETPLVGSGEEGSVTFVVPSGAGDVDYLCRPHAQMMRGRIGVVSK